VSSRVIIKNIVERKKAERFGFWLGNPHPDSWEGLHKYFGTKTEEELRVKLGDDFRWITPQYMETTYRHPEGKGIFDVYKTKSSLAESGPLANATSPGDVDRCDWPSTGFLNFEECITTLKNAGDVYRASGFWMPFFHDVADLFGMENLMLNMYTNPTLVHHTVNKVCGFYYEANDKFFREAEGLIDALFFGNDFGTQFDLLISPDQFNEFFYPWIKKFAQQAKSYNLRVIKHSCGSVYKIIDRYIDAGIDCLHPLQSRAVDMDAETLGRSYNGKIAFMGGIDTQELLVKGSQDDIKKEVIRIKRLLGPNLIVSPSHEAILPNIPPRNIAAMAEEAHRSL
jgi:uroporphyrinogen decarboxylase